MPVPAGAALRPARAGATPRPTETGREDMVVGPGETVPLLLCFDEYVNEHMPYMFHCHILHHKDQGMMGQALVVPA